MTLHIIAESSDYQSNRIKSNYADNVQITKRILQLYIDNKF